MLKAHVNADKYRSSKHKRKKNNENFWTRPDPPKLRPVSAWTCIQSAVHFKQKSFKFIFTAHGVYNAIGWSEISDLGVGVAGLDRPHNEISPTNKRGPRSGPSYTLADAPRSRVRTSDRRDLRRHATDFHRRHLELLNVREENKICVLACESGFKKRAKYHVQDRKRERETPAVLEAPRGEGLEKGTDGAF